MSSLSIRYCKNCSKPFNYKVSPYCPKCIIAIDEAFEKCRNYLEKNRLATIKELSEETEVSEKIILLLLKEGRLSMEGNKELRCESCDKPIDSGRYCLECTVKKHNELSYVKSSLRPGDRSTSKTQGATGKERMHFIPKSKKKDEEEE
ncbi:MAG: MerR family transcriptional regulator [Clostridiaceae bacterium]|nr:MerR family transcriptional regulator [Clostridiaceae bacterium]